ncbi:hypothetical protein JCM14244_07780 [Venenivibrio stagnispumantis]|uniref:CRISPR-associated protein Cas5t n=1 Tax=Venenivibrio stagnispumantis TaxID=407998 RepID=A0AA46AFG7_9AQUI|nr:CRISPR-associated protein Cas5 [Venenivibrio stagnispumantis]MCW4573823.1 CRISPR-associated protein Cas5 [Venenivibrio stagnispumantis]SMP18969.1 CRISPR-associated protein Cas5t [Venenivibrio stagnispumantis]
MIRLEIYQETAHFRIPSVGNPYLSYLLPPPSTIYGFLRAITDYESINFENTKLSIQGSYKSISIEKERLIKIRKGSSERDIIPIQKLHECRWIIHIKSPFEEKIIKAIKYSPKIFRLGRQEDLIIDITIEEGLEELPFNKYEDIYEEETNIYLKWEQSQGQEGSIFSMALDTIVDENKKIIDYKPVNLIYTRAETGAKYTNIFDGKYIISYI